MPRLEILSGKLEGTVVELSRDRPLEIGTRKECGLLVRDPWVSYDHARVQWTGQGYELEDLGSSNGTWVREGSEAPRRIERHLLQPGQLFLLGKTKVRFQDEAAPVQAAVESAGGGATPWWDQVLEGGNAEAGASRRISRLEEELAEERARREALERFLLLPPGSKAGDAARAGELEREVQRLRRELDQARAESNAESIDRIVTQRTEKLRRDQMSRLVELEDRAAQATARAVELENRLKSSAEQGQAELRRQREQHEAALERLKADLEAARSTGAGGDAELEAELERSRGELEQARGRAAAAEARAEELERELAAARADRDAARGEVGHWREEHQKVVQEIDAISMEQIEIEDRLKARIQELESRLRQSELGLPAPPPGEAEA